jgi:hypothetical protein
MRESSGRGPSVMQRGIGALWGEGVIVDDLTDALNGSGETPESPVP